MLVENEAKRAKAKIDEDATRRQAEEEALAKAAEESARRAAEEAERRRAEDARRRQAEEEQRRAEAEALLQRQEQEAKRRAAEARRLAQEEEKRRAEQARALAAAKEQQRRQQELRKAQEAEKRAAALKQRLAENNERKQTDEFSYEAGSGPKLSKAKLHIINDKTILEGEEDIFVFKAPSERPPSRAEAEKLLKQAEAQIKEKKDLPSFDIEYADEAAPQPREVKEDSQFSDSIVVELDNLTAKTGNSANHDSSTGDMEFSIPEDVKASHKPRSRRSLIALAASVVIMVAVSVIVITRPGYINKNAIADWTGDSNSETATRGLAAIRNSHSTSESRTVAEDRVKAQADAEFKQLLSQWRKDNHKDSPKP